METAKQMTTAECLRSGARNSVVAIGLIAGNAADAK